MLVKQNRNLRLLLLNLDMLKIIFILFCFSPFYLEIVSHGAVAREIQIIQNAIASGLYIIEIYNSEGILKTERIVVFE